MHGTASLARTQKPSHVQELSRSKTTTSLYPFSFYSLQDKQKRFLTFARTCDLMCASEHETPDPRPKIPHSTGHSYAICTAVVSPLPAAKQGGFGPGLHSLRGTKGARTGADSQETWQVHPPCTNTTYQAKMPPSYQTHHSPLKPFKPLKSFKSLKPLKPSEPLKLAIFGRGTPSVKALSEM